MTTSLRLAKCLAEQISCSRKEAEQYIAGGWVTVDGQVVEEPAYKLLPQQQIELLPKAKLEPIAPVTILLHKPAGIETDALIQNINPATLAENDRSGLRFLKRHTFNLTITNPIDIHSSGLVVLTQDWNISRKLIDDAEKMEHEFVVEVTGDINPNGLALLNYGLTFNGRKLPPIKVSWQNEIRLRFAIKGVQPLQIADMCKQVGLTVVTQKRIRIGRIPMSGLPSGQWRYLLKYERF